MADQTAPPFSWPLIAVGLFTAGAGIYFGLVGFEALPAPSPVNGPMWIALLVGVMFFAGGVAVIVSGATGAYDRAGDLPADTPVWIATVYWIAGLLMASGLAGIGTWVAFGGGTRHFSMTGFISGTASEIVGRSVFGIGAIITWLFIFAMARTGAKKIFGKKS